MLQYGVLGTGEAVHEFCNSSTSDDVSGMLLATPKDLDPKLTLVGWQTWPTRLTSPTQPTTQGGPQSR